ncbi:AAEL010034-PA, partial [Aedes aegypti]
LGLGVARTGQFFDRSSFLIDFASCAPEVLLFSRQSPSSHHHSNSNEKNNIISKTGRKGKPNRNRLEDNSATKAEENYY